MIESIIFGAALAAAPVKIGVLDAAIEANVQIENAQVVVLNNSNAWRKSATGDFHSYMILKTIRKGAEKTPLVFYYASPFNQTKAGETVDWNIAIRSLHEMKKHGVSLVCTAFGSPDAYGAGVFMAAADSLNMTVVASLGNGEFKTAYPAMIPSAVAVLRSDWKNSELSSYADYMEDGTAETARGSSYAAAKVCGRMAIGR